MALGPSLRCELNMLFSVAYTIHHHWPHINFLAIIKWQLASKGVICHLMSVAYHDKVVMKTTSIKLLLVWDTICSVTLTLVDV